MDKLLTVLLVCLAFVAQAQTWYTGTGAWISPFAFNLGIQKGLQLGDGIGNDTFYMPLPGGKLFCDTNYYQYQTYKGTVQYQQLLTQDEEMSTEIIDTAIDESQVIAISKDSHIKMDWTSNDSTGSVKILDDLSVGMYLFDENGDRVVTVVASPSQGFNVKMTADDDEVLTFPPDKGAAHIMADTFDFKNYSGDTVLRMLDDDIIVPKFTAGTVVSDAEGVLSIAGLSWEVVNDSTIQLVHSEDTFRLSFNTYNTATFYLEYSVSGGGGVPSSALALSADNAIVIGSAGATDSYLSGFGKVHITGDGVNGTSLDEIYIMMPNLPDDSTGLPARSLWIDGDVIKIKP